MSSYFVNVIEFRYNSYGNDRTLYFDDVTGDNTNQCRQDTYKNAPCFYIEIFRVQIESRDIVAI